MAAASPQVLIVEDEPDLADLYEAWLADSFEVSVSYEGRAALDALDDSVDVVLLDRRMPGLSGDEVLNRIRARDLGCRVVMVTAVVPDYDIIEMGFDDYLIKPIEKADLIDAVERMRSRNDYDAVLQELASLAAKQAVLRTGKTYDELLGNEEFRELENRIKELKDRADAMLASEEDLNFETLL